MADPEPLVYVGPTVDGLPLVQFDILSDGVVTSGMMAAITASDVVGATFITLSEYAATSQNYKPKGAVTFNQVKLIPRTQARPGR